MDGDFETVASLQNHHQIRAVMAVWLASTAPKAFLLTAGRSESGQVGQQSIHGVGVQAAIQRRAQNRADQQGRHRDIAL